MRSLSAALLAAQSNPDPEATVAIRCKRRGTFAGDPLAWRPIFLHSAANLPYGDAGVTAAACPCAENGSMLRVLRSQAAMVVGVQRFNVLQWTGTGGSWPSAAVAALTAAPTQLAALTVAGTEESTPAVHRVGSEIRTLFADGGRIWQVRSANDGVTFTAATSAANLSTTYGRVSNLVMCNVGAYWYAAFNAYTATAPTMRVRGLHNIGPGWGAWPEMPFDAANTEWQVAGLRPGPEGGCLYIYLVGTMQSAGLPGGYSVLACQRAAINADGRFGSWDGEPQIVDRAGPSNGIAYARARFGDAAGAYLFALQERAANGYWFVAALAGQPGSLDSEEPVYLAPAYDAVDIGVTSSEYFTPLQCGQRAWLVGAGGVYASAQADEGANLSIRTYTPVAYTYTCEANGGGVLAVQLDRPQSASSQFEKFAAVTQPEVYVGDILWLDRSLSTGSQDEEAMSLAFRVVQVAYGRDRIDVLAADALGVLAHMRPRRAKTLAAGERVRMQDVDALCHWCGLDVSGSGTLPSAMMPSPGFVWAANESGLGALRRYLMDQVTALRSAGADANPDGSPGQAHTAVQLLELPTQSSYTYVSPDGLRQGFGSHEIADWQVMQDGRQARLVVANGLATAGDPLGDQGVKGWAIAAARPLPGSRPYPLSLTDYDLATSDGALQALAAGQAQWLLFGLPFGSIEAGANLGIELYDVVTVDQVKGRVVGITETWERGDYGSGCSWRKLVRLG